MAPPGEDLTGRVFGRLTVISIAPSNGHGRRWRCRCSCGKEQTVAGFHLTDGDTTSCGCLLRETTAAMATTHGLSRTPEYTIWKAMKQRCYYKGARMYPAYGGRGIRVCPEWLNDAAAFIRDMGPRPSTRHSVERIDVDRDYEPSNCKWVHVSRQNSNKRTSQFVNLDGQRLTIRDAAEALGVNPGTLWWRIRHAGISEAAALTSGRLARRSTS